MLTFDIERLSRQTPNKFYLVIEIVDRVLALKRGTESKVERRGRDLISVAIDELEKDKVEWAVEDQFKELIKKKVEAGEL